MEIDDRNESEEPEELPGNAAPVESRANNEAPSSNKAPSKEEMAIDITIQNHSDDNTPSEEVHTSAQDENWADIVHGCK